MSSIEYRNLLFETSQEINWLSESQRLLFSCEGLIAEGNETNIPDALTLFKKLEEEDNLGIDRLEVLKDLMKVIGKWNLLERVKKFEIKREEFSRLLEHISRALDESGHLEQLVSICKGRISEDSESNIKDARSLLKELEKNNNLAIGRLDILKILIGADKPDLLQQVDEFETKRKQEDDVEEAKRTRNAQFVAVFSSVKYAGQRMIGTVTAHCSFRRVLGGGVVVTTWMLLRRCDSPEEFVRLFTGAVLPLGNFLLRICGGSVLFTIQAENISALKALWEQYQDGTLQRNLQKFLVTEEIKQLADGQELIVEVEINEQEYKNACLDLMVTAETQEIKVKGEKRSKIRRVSSDSKLYRHSRSKETDRELDQAELQLPSMSAFDKSREFVEKLEWSVPVQERSDSDSDFWSQSAPSEIELDRAKGALLADVLREKPGVIEELALCLDREMRLIPNWKYLSRELKVDAEVITGLEQYTDISPTIRLFEYLEITRPELTIQQLKEALSEIRRKDLCVLLTSKAGLVKEVITSRSTEDPSLRVGLLDEIALALDGKSKAVANWETLARRLGVPREIFKQFERRSAQSPTNQLFEYLASIQPQMTLKPLKEALERMKRNDLLKLLLKLEDEVLLKDVMTPDSELLLTAADKLDIKHVAWAQNWRKLAYHLNIPSDVYKEFGDTTTQRKSPTKEIMQWLVARRPDITLPKIVEALEKIKRRDAILIITKEFPHTVVPDVESILSSEPPVSKEVVLQQFFKSTQLDQTSVELAKPEAKRLIRWLATIAKHSKRLDVFKQLREITPAGTTGPLLPDQLDIREIPLHQMRQLTICLSGTDDWKFVAERLGFSSPEIRFLDKQSLNPFDHVLAVTANRRKLSVGYLYDVLSECGLPVVADLL